MTRLVAALATTGWSLVTVAITCSSGGSGNDTLIAGSGGHDTLSGGSGDDLFKVGLHGDDTVLGGGGSDKLDLAGNWSDVTSYSTDSHGVTTIHFAGGQQIEVKDVETIKFGDGHIEHLS